MNGSWLIRSDCTSGPRLKSLLSETIAKKPRDKSKGIEINEFAGNGCNAHSSSNETRKRNTHAVSTEDGNKEMKKMKTAKSNTLEIRAGSMVEQKMQPPKTPSKKKRPLNFNQ